MRGVAGPAGLSLRPSIWFWIGAKDGRRFGRRVARSSGGWPYLSRWPIAMNSVDSNQVDPGIFLLGLSMNIL